MNKYLWLFVFGALVFIGALAIDDNWSGQPFVIATFIALVLIAMFGFWASMNHKNNGESK